MNHIRYVEYNASHNSDFVFDLPCGHDCWLLLLTHTPALFWVDGELREYPAHCAVLFTPGSKIYYRASQECYENDWLRFDSTEVSVSSFPVQGRPFPLPDFTCFHQLFQLLTWEHTLPGPSSDRIIDQLISILFTKLRDAILESESHIDLPRYQELVLLRKEIMNSPQLPWNISLMADRLHISRGYLQTLYKNTFQISCMDDVIAARIRLACDQLRYTNRTIQEIAELCGYNHTEHFCRQFHRQTGQTPKAYRSLTSELSL